MHLETLDLAVVAIYAVSLLFLAQWVSREKAGHEKDTKDYFLTILRGFVERHPFNRELLPEPAADTEES